MNISDINNRPNANESLGKSRELTSRDKTSKANGSEDLLTSVPDTESPEQTTVQPARDAYHATKEQSFISELTAEIENAEAPVREETVARARQRISEGYYNSKDFLGTLATRLINTEN
jgi:hypothetical protein